MGRKKQTFAKGDKIYAFTFISEAEEDEKRPKRLVTVKCFCGKVFTRRFYNLKTSKSCGCIKPEIEKFEPGDVFHNITLVKEIPGITMTNTGSFRRRGLWKCYCGNTWETDISYVKHNRTKSCGCLLTETNTKHGISKSRLANTFSSMKGRCYNPNNSRYSYYGMRGISVCEEWLNNSSAFFDWAMSNGYTQELTIERKDNDKGYSPENCIWATYTTQNRNKRSTRTSVEEVRRIRAFHIENPSLTYKEVGKAFNLLESHVSDIIANRTWKEGTLDNINN